MAKPKVLATHRLFEPARKILQENCEVEYWEEPERPPREEVLRRVKDKEALVCLLTEKVNDELLQAAPQLKVLSGAGGQFVFQLSGDTNVAYVLQTSTNLMMWTPDSTNILPGGFLIVTNPIIPGPFPEFWRALWQP